MSQQRTATFTVTDMSTNKAISVAARVIKPFLDFYIEKGGKEINNYKIGETITLVIETEGEREKEFTIDLSEQDAIFEDENGQQVEDKFKKKVIGAEGLKMELKVAKRKKTEKRSREITVTDDKENLKSRKALLKYTGICIYFGGAREPYVYGSQETIPEDKFVKGTIEYLDTLKKVSDNPKIRALDEKGRNLIDVMMKSDYEVSIKMFDKDHTDSMSQMRNPLQAQNGVSPMPENGKLVIGSSSTIYYDTKDKVEGVGLDENGISSPLPPLIVLGHELWHSYQGVLGIAWHIFEIHPDFKLSVPEVSSTHFENILRAIYHLPLRKWYHKDQKEANAVPLIDENGVRSETNNAVYGNTEKYDYKKEHGDAKTY